MRNPVLIPSMNQARQVLSRFLDGDPSLQNRVAEVAKEWSEHANIKFDFGNHANAQIRIAFVQGAGSWSAVGTDALVGEDLEQERVTLAAVDDVHFVDAEVHGLERALHLRDHPARDHLFGDQPLRVLSVE